MKSDNDTRVEKIVELYKRPAEVAGAALGYLFYWGTIAVMVAVPLLLGWGVWLVALGDH